MANPLSHAVITAVAAVLVACCLSATLAAPSSNGVYLHNHRPQARQLTLVAEVASESSFRLGVRFGDSNPTAIDCPALAANRAIAPFKRVAWGSMAGVATSFGALLVSPAGAWALYDSANNTLLSSAAPPSLDTTDQGTISLHVNGSSAQGGAQPCLGNGEFGPPFYWDSQAGALAFAVSAWEYDPASPATTYVHCYPAGFADAQGHYAGPDWLQATLGLASPAPTAPAPGPGLPGRVGWWAVGYAADWYLAPAAQPYDFTRALFQLTGAPALPPRYGMAFMATYWGYSSMQQVQS